MKFSYKLKANDYLTNQLYQASKSESIIAQRKKSVILVPITYLFLAAFGFYSGMLSLGVGFIIIAILWYLIYPIYQRKKYYKHYRNYINENYSDAIDVEVSAELTDEAILFVDDKAESKLKIEAINSITELKEVYLVNIADSRNLIFSKSESQNNPHTVREFVGQLAAKKGIEIFDETSWIWK